MNKILENLLIACPSGPTIPNGLAGTLSKKNSLKFAIIEQFLFPSIFKQSYQVLKTSMFPQK
jgi:hypothetical protein